MRLSLKGRIFVAVVWSACMASVVFGEEGSTKARGSLVAGVTYSSGLGEKPYAPYLEGRVQIGPWRLNAAGEMSRKLETMKGFRLAADAERSFGLAIVTGGVRFRSGGTWSKTGAWAGVGVGTNDVRVILRHELPTGAGLNDVYSLTGTLAHGTVEFQAAAYSYRQSFSTTRATGSTLLVAYRLGR